MLVKTKKDQAVEQLRQKIEINVSLARETDDAEALLDSLSYESALHPNRHIWIELAQPAINIDLEDWGVEEEWDNTVARVSTQAEKQALAVIQAWLSGAELSALSQNGIQLDMLAQKAGMD